MKLRKRKKLRIVFFAIFLFLLFGTVVWKWSDSNLTNLKQNAKVDRKTVTEGTESFTRSCIPKNNENIQKQFGTVEDIRTSINGNTVKVEGLKDTVVAVVESGSFSSGKHSPVNGTVSITIPDKPDDPVDLTTLKVYIYPKERYENGEALCETDDALYFIAVEPEQTAQTNDVYYSEACTNYRNQYGGIPEMRQAVSYCFEETTDAAYSLETVQSWINTAESAYRLKQGILANNKQLTKDPDAVDVDDPSKQQTLYCNAFTFDTFDENGKLKNYANVKKYTHTKTTPSTHGYCETECQETVTVKFQAPVALQIGHCFPYQVEIESKVECIAKETHAPPVLQRKPVCIPRASCYGTYDHGHDQGGPTEEFDSCILDCDGGKYSQKCINSCYQKTYGNQVKTTNSKMLNYNNKETVKFVDDCPNCNKASLNVNGRMVTCNNSFHEGNWSSPDYTDENGQPYSAEEIYAFRQKYPGGRYEKQGGVWTWIRDDSECGSDTGYYYFSTLALTRSLLNGYRRPDKVDEHYISKDSFKMEYNDTFKCDSVCSWVGCPNEVVLPADNEGANSDYQRQLNEYNADWQQCNANATCDTTTTVYTVTIDKDDKDSVNYEVYKTSQKPGNEPSKDGDGIIIDYSGRCYDKEDGWEYRNVITFPRLWEANKNFLLTTKEPNDSANYTYKGNVFCTSRSSKEVNLNWYEWKMSNGNILYGDVDLSGYLHPSDVALLQQYNARLVDFSEQQKKVADVNRDGSIDADDVSALLEALSVTDHKTDFPDRTNNINVHIGSGENNKGNDHLWGLMGWNFDINCFYAAAQPPGPGEETDIDISTDPKCTNGKCQPDPDNPTELVPQSLYTFRTVSLTDMFPEREARWNWSCNASNTNNENYPVQPSTITEEIEKKGNSIYQDEAELDYDIVLNRDTMKKIREYNKSKKSYTDFDLAALKDTEKVEGVTVYKSKFLNSLGTEVIKKRGLLGCNNQTGESCDRTIVKDQCYTAFNLGG